MLSFNDMRNGEGGRFHHGKSFVLAFCGLEDDVRSSCGACATPVRRYGDGVGVVFFRDS